eukprot:3046614-Karenia_brevis.AAC.1
MRRRRSVDGISSSAAIALCMCRGHWQQVVSGCGLDVISFSAAMDVQSRYRRACGLDAISFHAAIC